LKQLLSTVSPQTEKKDDQGQHLKRLKKRMKKASIKTSKQNHRGKMHRARFISLPRFRGAAVGVAGRSRMAHSLAGDDGGGIHFRKWLRTTMAGSASQTESQLIMTVFLSIFFCEKKTDSEGTNRTGRPQP
jgi:hypothetical protein